MLYSEHDKTLFYIHFVKKKSFGTTSEQGASIERSVLLRVRFQSSFRMVLSIRKLIDLSELTMPLTNALPLFPCPHSVNAGVLTIDVSCKLCYQECGYCASVSTLKLGKISDNLGTPLLKSL